MRPFPGADRARGGAGQVFATLREEIISLALAPGSVLARQALQERFGVSSTPIRDALMRLQEEGLVEIFPQHATLVSRIDVGKARQAQFLRRSVELELVHALAGQRDEPLLARLRSLIRQQSAFAELGEYEAFTTVDQAFHRAFFEALDLGDLFILVRRQGGHIDRLRRLHLPVAGKMREVVIAHTAIVEAIAAGDAPAAQAALRGHLSSSIAFVSALRATYPAYFGVDDQQDLANAG